MTGTSCGQQPDGTRPGEVEPPSDHATRQDEPAGAAPTAQNPPPGRAAKASVPVRYRASAPAPRAERSSGTDYASASASDPAAEVETATETSTTGAGPGIETAAETETATEAETGIEATTGAPVAALPQRVPVRSPSSPWFPSRSSGDGPPGPARTGVPEPAGPVDDEPAFWLPIEEVHWDGRPVDPDAPPPPDRSVPPGRSPRRTGPVRKPPRHPAVGLAGLVLFSLLASFFAWVSAEPLWLALGRGLPGTATVLDCTGSGLGQRCRGEFEAADGAFLAEDVRLAGVDAAHSDPGSQVPARMVDRDSGTAYVESGAATRHLRWLLGLATALACAGGVVWVTGALRLPDGRTRRWGVALGLAGPLLITVGFLLAGL
ncbi:hypothetical protein AB0J86_23745 [Micromonospora sp. NPDC049559]|uniref:hypothetical protein n=1 Tax=Micromonospora sp. NPDC049559 TaxID=3155923 RepID=UPI00343886F3